MGKSRSPSGRVLSLLAAMLLLASGCVTVDDGSSGAEIYDQVCARCHGVELQGGVGPGLGAGTEVADRDDEYYTQTIARGRGRMPGFRSTLTDDQIDRVIQYLRQEQSQ